jgi:hypothetical protein
MITENKGMDMGFNQDALVVSYDSNDRNGMVKIMGQPSGAI